MSRGITLTRYDVASVFVPQRGDAFRLRIVASDNVLMPLEVFLHQQLLADPYTGQTIEDFVTVTSPFDATIYPANEPAAGQLPAFYRKSELDVLLPSSAAVEQAWTDIHAAVCNLVEAYNRLDLLQVSEAVRCGEEFGRVLFRV